MSFVLAKKGTIVMALLTLSILFNSFCSYLQHFSSLQSKSPMVCNDSADTDLHLGLIPFRSLSYWYLEELSHLKTVNNLRN